MMNKTMPPSTLGVSFRLTNYKITILNYPYYPFIYHKFISPVCCRILCKPAQSLTLRITNSN